MEEKKQNQNPQEQKLSYDKLKEVASELNIQYQKAVQYIQKLEQQLERANFNRTAFLLDSLFKVMDHAELYDEEFVTWTKDNIQEAVKEFYQSTLPAETEGDENPKE